MAKIRFNIIDNVIVFLIVLMGYIYNSTFSFAYPICLSFISILCFLSLFKIFFHLKNYNIPRFTKWPLSIVVWIFSGIIVTMFQIGKSGIDSYLIVSLISGLALTFSDTNNIARKFLIASIFCFVIHFILYFSGIISDPIQMIRIENSTIVYRSTLGFNHPNTPFRFFLPIVLLLYFVLSKKKFKFIITPFLIVISIYIYNETNSRTVFYLLLVFFLIVFLDLDRIVKYKFPLIISRYIFWIIAGISIIMAIMWGSPDNEINIVFTGRLNMWRLCLENGIKLFGGINLPSGIYVDNSVMFILAQCGLVPFLITGCLYSKFIKLLIKEHEYKMCLIVFIFMIISFSENNLFRYSTNFILIFAFKYLFKYEWSTINIISLKEKLVKINKSKIVLN